MSNRFGFPPPASGSGDEWDRVDYSSGAPESRFIFPPPQKVDPEEGYEAMRQVAGEINAIRDTATDAGEQVANLGTVVADYGEILERKVEPWAVPTISPLSSTINRRADPTFQLSDFMSPLMRETTDPWKVSAPFALGRGWSEKGVNYFAFITPAINRAYEQLNFLVGQVSNPCRMDVGVFVVDDSRVLRRQVHSQDVGATIGTGESVVSVSFPRWIATQGSYVAVCWIQYGSGNTRQLLGLDDTPRPLSGAVFPRRIGSRTPGNSYTSVPASLDGTTGLTFDSDWFVPYAELSEHIGIDYRNFHHPFNYTGYINRPWVNLTTYAAYANDGSVGTYRELFPKVGTRIAVYDTPLSTDNLFSSARMHRYGSGGYAMFVLRGSNDLTTGTAVFVSNTSVEVRTWNTSQISRVYWPDSVVRASKAHTLVDGETISATVMNGVVTVSSSTAGVLLEWTDTITPAGPLYRFVGFGVERTNNSYSPRIRSWSARDIPVTDEGDEGEEGETP